MYDTRILEKKLEDSVRMRDLYIKLNDTRSELNRLQIKYNELCMDRCDDPSLVKIE